jgi:anti-anti-sigma factor
MPLHTGEQRQLASFCSVSIERDAEAALIRLEGELDLSCEYGFRAEVARVMAWQPSTVIIDLRDLTFIDPPGLRMLVELGGAARRDDFELTLIHADGQVQKVLSITGLDRMLPLDQSPYELREPT